MATHILVCVCVCRMLIVCEVFQDFVHLNSKKANKSEHNEKKNINKVFALSIDERATTGMPIDQN